MLTVHCTTLEFCCHDRNISRCDWQKSGGGLYIRELPYLHSKQVHKTGKRLEKCDRRVGRGSGDKFCVVLVQPKRNCDWKIFL
jgi:hypothetical protein